MKKEISLWLLAVTLTAGLASTSMAEPPEFDRPPSNEQIERTRERIETLRVWRLTKALDLDEKSSAQVFPILNKYDKKRAETERALRTDMRDLRDALMDRKEDRLKNLLERLEQNHKAMQKLNDEERADLKRVLTVEQQAKYIVFQQDFEREIRRIIEEKKAGRFANDRPGRPVPPVK